LGEPNEEINVYGQGATKPYNTQPGWSLGKPEKPTTLLSDASKPLARRD